MKTHNRKGGYSANTAKEYIDNKQAIYCLSTELEPQLKLSLKTINQLERLSLIKLGLLKKDSRLLLLNLNQKLNYLLIWQW